ncbi:hypothetical protein AB6A40_000316 [Gnathostoma spinigerum]|uniref:Calcineurin-like phosphoesterase domain-containing protein n=1 Tax=Gnathostoma spinigerum TaxID=75299 RepID=A0ABD6EAA6_9BILA
MYRSFQTIMSVLKPQVVFFLGDQFDEGNWCSEDEFLQYADRLDSLFYVSNDVRRYFVAGNHDVGFHSSIFPHRLLQFSKRYERGLVDLVQLENSYFVLLNSMAFQRDGCRLCQRAETELSLYRNLFDCVRNNSEECRKKYQNKIPTSRPILVQHFPLFRESDEFCPDDPSAAVGEDKTAKFRPDWDCLSINSTHFLLEALKPRAVFSGHVHYSCEKWWSGPYSFWEWTLPSFSWRNNKQPAVLLGVVSEDDVVVSKCYLPNERTVWTLYGFSVLFLIFVFVISFVKRWNNHDPTYSRLLLVKSD